MNCANAGKEVENEMEKTQKEADKIRATLNFIDLFILYQILYLSLLLRQYLDEFGKIEIALAKIK